MHQCNFVGKNNTGFVFVSKLAAAGSHDRKWLLHWTVLWLKCHIVICILQKWHGLFTFYLSILISVCLSICLQCCSCHTVLKQKLLWILLPQSLQQIDLIRLYMLCSNVQHNAGSSTCKLWFTALKAKSQKYCHHMIWKQNIIFKTLSLIRSSPFSGKMVWH